MNPDDRILDLLAAGKAAWPELALDRAAFVRHLEKHLASATDRGAALARVRPDDFFLACACAEGEQKAILAFEQRFSKVIERAVSRFAKTDERRAELKQVLRERLFVSEAGKGPRIASYAGQGFLENWVRVAAMRAFVNAERSEKTRGEPDDLERLADANDLELGFLKAHYRSAFRAAFARAVASLDAPERLVLRLSILENLTSDELGAALGVHRATAARRAARARQRLMDLTREELRASLRVDDTELASILNVVQSHLDLSISRLLAG